MVSCSRRLSGWIAVHLKVAALIWLLLQAFAAARSTTPEKRGGSPKGVNAWVASACSTCFANHVPALDD